ncbi:S8 family serine peptidase [Actinokineospora sp. NPDC004072]
MLVVAGVLAAPPAAAEVITAADPVDGSYLVVLRAGPPDEVARELTGEHGGEVAAVYASALKGFSATMTEEQARAVAADSRVSFVEQDRRVELADVQVGAPWGVDRVDQRYLPLDNRFVYTAAGRRVDIYVIDSGIAIDHQDFGGRARHGRDVVDDDDDASDCLGHGTRVASVAGGTTHGVAKRAALVGVRVVGCAPTGTATDLLEGIDWVTRTAVQPAVAILSLSTDESRAINQAVLGMMNAGVVTTVAAGNNGADACGRSPAGAREAITVGATGRDDARVANQYWTSNYGWCVDIWAPGEGIASAAHDSATGTTTASGTSMAAAHVAGAAALELERHPYAGHHGVLGALVNKATPQVLTNLGPGSPNRMLYSRAIDDPPPCYGVGNYTDVPIPDAGSGVTSAVTVVDCPGKASATAKVPVKIRHTYIGDLMIHLLAPDGSYYLLKAPNSGDSRDNIDTTYTVNLSDEDAVGEWRLRVQDVSAGDTGYLDSWILMHGRTG